MTISTWRLNGNTSTVKLITITAQKRHSTTRIVRTSILLRMARVLRIPIRLRIAMQTDSDNTKANSAMQQESNNNVETSNSDDSKHSAP
eukprot:6093621-Lingulodinium_polyedra.AAC.1